MDEQFKPVTATPIVDPTKHVNYSYGMVLGVDDFTQEFVYHSERDQWMTRDIDGYGTVSGLRVSVAENANGEREVIVSAGAAVNPRGQMICVPVAQCAVVERWLAVEANRKGAEKKAGESPGAPLSVYVVLCYRECPTDKVPVPGEPCRAEDETVAPSRLKDDFRLELRLAPPAQTEELALRSFVRLLRDHIEFTDEVGESEDEDSYAEAVREIAEASYYPSSPPDSPPGYGEESPPRVFRVPAEFRCAFLRCAFRVWVTEIRPRVRPDLPGSHCSCADERHDHDAHGGDEDCVLLAELQVYLTPDALADETRDVRVVEAQRPLLVHQRMLQEWMLCGSCCAGEADGGGGPLPPSELALDDLSDVSAPAPAAGEVLTFDGSEWIAAPPAGDGSTGAASGDLEGTYPAPTVAGLRGRAVSADEPDDGQVLTWEDGEWKPADVPPDDDAIHTGDAAGGDLAGTYPNPTVAGLQARPVSNAEPAAGNVLTWDESSSQWGPAEVPAVNAIRPGDAAGGDLSATYPNPTVAGLQTRAVSDAAPNAGDVLTWDEAQSQWRPAVPPAPPAPPPAVRTLLPFVTVIEGGAEDGTAFFFWFNVDAPGNRAELIGVTRGTLRAFAETVDAANGFVERIDVISLDPVAGQRNVFRCVIARRPPLLRLTFELRRLQLRMEGRDVPVFEYMRSRELNFVGFDGASSVTAFVAAGVGRRINA